MSKLIPDGIRAADYVRNVHRVSPAATDTLEDVMQPEYWVHVAPKLRVGDKLEIFPEGGAWYAEALVVACSNIHVKLHVLNKAQINEPTVAVKDAPKAPFIVEFKGPQRKWSVIRSKDKTYVKEGFDDRGTAEAWLRDNAKDMG